MGGRFSLAQATRTLPAGDQLVATIETTLGKLSCELWPRRAPRTVANFVGLATGTRPWRDHGGWRARPAYNGSLFYRVSPQLGIRGGREGTVPTIAPGYFVQDERWEGMRHDKAGLLCAVGAGIDRVGMEFLITTAPTPQLDEKPGERSAFTVFGSCAPLERIQRIAASRAVNGRPQQPVVIKRLRVERPQQPSP